MQTTTFLEAFCAKGRFRDLLSHVPVRIIANDKTALFGAGRVAALGLSAGSGALARELNAG